MMELTQIVAGVAAILLVIGVTAYVTWRYPGR